MPYHIKDQSHLHIDDLFTAANNIKGLQALVVALLEIASVACVDLVCFTAHNELWQTLMIPMGFTFRDDGHLFGVAVKTANYKRILLILRAGGLPVAIPILKVLAVWLSKHLNLKARRAAFYLITGEITDALPKLFARLRVGLLHVLSSTPRRPLCINENADPSVRRDF